MKFQLVRRLSSRIPSARVLCAVLLSGSVSPFSILVICVRAGTDSWYFFQGESSKVPYKTFMCSCCPTLIHYET